MICNWRCNILMNLCRATIAGFCFFLERNKVVAPDEEFVKTRTYDSVRLLKCEFAKLSSVKVSSFYYGYVNISIVIHS